MITLTPLKNKINPPHFQILAVLLPLIIFSIYYYFRKDVYDFHHAILGTYSTLFLYFFFSETKLGYVLHDAHGYLMKFFNMQLRSSIFCSANWSYNGFNQRRCW